MGQKYEPHVLLLPYPSQGHITHILQFAKRLSSTGIRISLAALTWFISNSTKPEPGPVSTEHISDGFDENGFSSAQSVEDYLTRFESVGPETLTDLIDSLYSKGRPVRVLVYDAFLPWALDVANQLFGIRTAAFFTQSCAADAIYWQVWEGQIKCPVTKPLRLGTGSVQFERGDLPTYLWDPDPGPYLAYFALLLNQFRNLKEADVVLINSFCELEPAVNLLFYRILLSVF